MKIIAGIVIGIALGAGAFFVLMPSEKDRGPSVALDRALKEIYAGVDCRSGGSIGGTGAEDFLDRLDRCNEAWNRAIRFDPALGEAIYDWTYSAAPDEIRRGGPGGGQINFAGMSVPPSLYRYATQRNRALRDRYMIAGGVGLALIALGTVLGVLLGRRSKRRPQTEAPTTA